MFDCEAQGFPKGVLPLRSNPSVPLCLVSATPERLTVVAPGRRGSSQNVKMHHRGLFNSIASKPATNRLYPFIAKYRYSNVRQVLSENGETRKTSWFIIISPDKNCDNTSCFGQTHMIVHHCNQTSTVLSLHFGFRLQRECCSRTSATCKRRGSAWCKNMQKQHVLLSYITSMSWRKTENVCSNTHLDVQLHLRMCVHPCILDIFCPMNIYSMSCNYAKPPKKDKRTVLSNKRPGDQVVSPSMAQTTHIGTKKFEATILKSMEGHACCVFGGMHSPTCFTTICCHQNVRSFVTNVTWKHVRMFNVSQLKRRYYTYAM